jgi:hypothetical protein
VPKEFNLIEASNFLNDLIGRQDTDELTVIEEHLPAFGFEKSKRTLKMLLNLKFLHKELENYVVEKKIELPEVFQISRLELTDQRTILGLVLKANLSFSKFKEVLMNLLELALKNKVSIASIIEDERISSILEDKNSDRNLRGERVRKMIFSLRYPKISKLKRKI